MSRLEYPGQVGIPKPHATSVTTEFWAACKQERLIYQYCLSCELANFIPAMRCRHCLSPKLVWQQSSGEGSLYSWSIVWRPQMPSFRVPYAVAIVELDEGYKMFSNVVEAEPEGLFRGMRLSVIFHVIDDELTLPYFRPAAS